MGFPAEETVELLLNNGHSARQEEVLQQEGAGAFQRTKRRECNWPQAHSLPSHTGILVQGRIQRSVCVVCVRPQHGRTVFLKTVLNKLKKSLEVLLEVNDRFIQGS